MNLRVPQPGRGWLGPAITAIVLALTGCGGGSSLSASSTTAPASSSPSSSAGHAPSAGGQGGNNNGGAGSGEQTIPTPRPTGIPAATASVRVIQAWSSALRRGDVRAAAQYFALPSVMINGPYAAGAMLVLTIRTRAEAVAANASLPCGAKFISADQRGRYVNALFELTNRPGPGGGCAGGIGQTARTNMVIRKGLIVEWIRAPDDPGDNGSNGSPPPGAPGPNPTVPAA
jgi:hypothetical protein